jgi:hypothetical protein
VANDKVSAHAPSHEAMSRLDNKTAALEIAPKSEHELAMG